MKNDEKKALQDFEDWTQNPTIDMQEFINVHKSYCRTVAILSNVKYLSLLLDSYYDADADDQKKFLNKLYETKDLMEED
jgi:hypothetical protein